MCSWGIGLETINLPLFAPLYITSMMSIKSCLSKKLPMNFVWSGVHLQFKRSTLCFSQRTDPNPKKDIALTRNLLSCVAHWKRIASREAALCRNKPRKLVLYLHPPSKSRPSFLVCADIYVAKGAPLLLHGIVRKKKPNIIFLSFQIDFSIQKQILV